jgi:hypothetical protein
MNPACVSQTADEDTHNKKKLRTNPGTFRKQALEPVKKKGAGANHIHILPAITISPSDVRTPKKS